MMKPNLIDVVMVDGDTYVRVNIKDAAEVEIKDGIVKVISDTGRLIIHDKLSNMLSINITNREHV